MARIRGRRAGRLLARVGAPDAALTANGGLAALRPQERLVTLTIARVCAVVG